MSEPSYVVARGEDALRALAAEWNELEDACCSHPFQTHDFVSLWQRHVGSTTGAQPLMVTLRDGARLMGVFPAASRIIHGMPAVTWLGGPEMLDYGDILFRPGSGRQRVDAFVERSLSMLASAAPLATLYLTNVRTDALAYPTLQRKLPVLKAATAPYVHIEGDFADYLASRKHTLRSNLERKFRKMQRTEGVRFETLMPGDADIERTMERLVDFQRLRFQHMTKRTALYQIEQVRFRLGQALTCPGVLLFRLVAGERVHAASLHVVRMGQLYNMTGGFDPASSAYSPGTVLQRFAIEMCFQNGWKTYDFGWGGQSYKYDWATHEIPLTTFVSDNLRGRALMAGRTASRRVASMFGGLPAGDH